MSCTCGDKYASGSLPMSDSGGQSSSYSDEYGTESSGTPTGCQVCIGSFCLRCFFFWLLVAFLALLAIRGRN